MFYSTLFYLVFVSQIVVISFYFPRKLVKQSSQSATTNGMGLPHDIDKKLMGYTRVNNLIAVLGLGLLAAFIYFDWTVSVTAVLASIGVYFLLQLSPLAIPAVRQLMAGLKASRPQNSEHQELPHESGKLFDYVSPLQIGIALGLSLIWLGIKLPEWNGEINTQLLNIGIFVGGQLFIVALVARNLRMLARGDVDQNEDAKGIEDPRLAIPMLVYISIGLSVYSLAKQFLLVLDLHQIRPIMMSFTLLLLATLAFDKLIRDLWQRPVSLAADTPRQS